MRSIQQNIKVVVRERLKAEVGKAVEPERIREFVFREINTLISEAVNEAMVKERDELLGREPYEREGGSIYRNGYKRAAVAGCFGTVELNRPVLRKGTFFPEILRALIEAGKGMIGILAQRFWLRGASTRAVAEEINQAFGTHLSATSVSKLTNALEPTVKAWEERKIPWPICYLYLDALYLPVRKESFTCKQALLVAIGVDENHHKHFLGFVLGDRESTASWGLLIKNLLDRGLSTSSLRLVISDACQGIITAVGETLGVRHQLCLVHKHRNVLALIPAKDKKAFDASFKAVFWTDSKSSAHLALKELKLKWSRQYPKAARMVEDRFDMYTTFFDEPSLYWTMCRSTNLIERFNREIRRRFDPAGAMQSELEVSKLLWAVACAQEDRWAKHRVHLSKSSGKEVLPLAA